MGDAVLSPFDAYGPGPAGALPDAYGGGRPGTVDPADPTPGLKDLTEKSLEATAYSSNIFMRESGRPDPHTHVDVHEIEAASAGRVQTRSGTPRRTWSRSWSWMTGRFASARSWSRTGWSSPASRTASTPRTARWSSPETPRSPTTWSAWRRAPTSSVHEVIDLDFYRNSTGYSEALLHHMAAAHTDVTEVGPLAQRCGVHTLVLTHITPADTFLVPHGSWRRRAQRGFHGRVLVGNDLDRIRLSG